MKSGKDSTAFIFGKFSENGITFVRMCLFLKIKNAPNLRKPGFFRKQGSLCMRNCKKVMDVANVYYAV